MGNDSGRTASICYILGLLATFDSVECVHARVVMVVVARIVRVGRDSGGAATICSTLLWFGL